MAVTITLTIPTEYIYQFPNIDLSGVLLPRIPTLHSTHSLDITQRMHKQRKLGGGKGRMRITHTSSSSMK